MKKQFIICVLFFLYFHNHSTVYSVPSYSADEIWTKLNSGDSILLIDIRDNKQYLEGHIPTAINIPYSGTVNQSIINLISSYDRLENIAYCSCTDGSSSKAFADSVLEYNLTLVLYMHDDFRYWPYSIVTGSEPGTDIGINNNNSPSSSNNSPYIEPFFVINVVLGVLIIVILLRKRSNS